MIRILLLILLATGSHALGQEAPQPTFKWRVKAGDRFDLSLEYDYARDSTWVDDLQGKIAKTKHWRRAHARPAIVEEPSRRRASSRRAVAPRPIRTRRRGAGPPRRSRRPGATR
jgi:hypothetical protein